MPELRLARCRTSRGADGELTAWGCLIRRERFGFLLVLALAAVNQANGATSVLNYSTTLLMSNHFEVPVELAVMLSLLLIATKLLGVLASLLLTGRCGRRMLLLAGALLTAGCFALAAGACAYGSLAGVLVGLFGCVLSYGLTLAPTLHLLLAELFSPTARPLGACLATALTFSAGAVVDLSLLSLVDALGWSIVLGLLGCVCLLGGLPVMLLPETCGRTLSEIQEPPRSAPNQRQLSPVRRRRGRRAHGAPRVALVRRAGAGSHEAGELRARPVFVTTIRCRMPKDRTTENSHQITEQPQVGRVGPSSSTIRLGYRNAWPGADSLRLRLATCVVETRFHVR